MINRIDLISTAAHLLGQAALRAWMKPKNYLKTEVPDLAECISELQGELDEVVEAFATGRVEDVIDELGDVAAWCGLCLWRAAQGDES